MGGALALRLAERLRLSSTYSVAARERVVGFATQAPSPNVACCRRVRTCGAPPQQTQALGAARPNRVGATLVITRCRSED